MHEHNINSILLPKPNSTGIPNSKLKVKYSDNKSPLNGDYVHTYRAEAITLMLAPSSGGSRVLRVAVSGWLGWRPVSSLCNRGT